MRAIARRHGWAARLSMALTIGALVVSASVPAEAALPWAAAEPARPPSSATKPAPSLTDALVSVGELGRELKLIDRRLVDMEQTLKSLDKSLGGINGSLVPVADLARPEGLRAAVEPIVDRALDRAQGLILLTTACAAGLILLHALLRRWTGRRDVG
jgi:hypothetical protein